VSVLTRGSWLLLIVFLRVHALYHLVLGVDTAHHRAPIGL
jgi:hypothetical protein